MNSDLWEALGNIRRSRPDAESRFLDLTLLEARDRLGNDASKLLDVYESIARYHTVLKKTDDFWAWVDQLSTHAQSTHKTTKEGSHSQDDPETNVDSFHDRLVARMKENSRVVIAPTLRRWLSRCSNSLWLPAFIYNFVLLLGTALARKSTYEPTFLLLLGSTGLAATIALAVCVALLPLTVTFRNPGFRGSLLTRLLLTVAGVGIALPVLMGVLWTVARFFDAVNYRQNWQGIPLSALTFTIRTSEIGWTPTWVAVACTLLGGAGALWVAKKLYWIPTPKPSKALYLLALPLMVSGLLYSALVASVFWNGYHLDPELAELARLARTRSETLSPSAQYQEHKLVKKFEAGPVPTKARAELSRVWLSLGQSLFQRDYWWEEPGAQEYASSAHWQWRVANPHAPLSFEEAELQIRRILCGVLRQDDWRPLCSVLNSAPLAEAELEELLGILTQRSLRPPNSGALKKIVQEDLVEAVERHGSFRYPTRESVETFNLNRMWGLC